MIRITSKKEGFRRAGCSHPKGQVEYANDHFTAEQMKALLDEPLLVVEAVPDQEEEKAKGSKKSTAKENTQA